MFETFALDSASNTFSSLLNSNAWESFSPSRQGANLVRIENDLIPIVRTTTSFTKASQPFSAIHYNIIESIKNAVPDKALQFNNAMAEIYEPQYGKMGFHSDQALDLAQDSWICIFSCYENEVEPDLRKLVVKNKMSGEVSEINMAHNSALLFSTSTNEHFTHKIVSGPKLATSRWLGITFRFSKTFVRYKDGTPYLVSSNKVLSIADEKERKEFMQHKSAENKQLGYNYPEISYTLSSVI